MSVVPETLPEPDAFLPQLQELLIKEHVLSIIQAAGASLVASIIPDPVSFESIGKVDTFRGLLGCQMVSFLVQVAHVLFTQCKS